MALSDDGFPENAKRVGQAKVPVPWRDWSAVLTGEKRQFRQPARACSLLLSIVKVPSPVVAYTNRKRLAWKDERLMVLEGFRYEPLGAISADDLALEGFESLADFRRYWIGRHTARRWNMLGTVAVVNVRPWQEGDRAVLADSIFDQLYGTWADEPALAIPA